jgi:tetratricopeptide (TPR) repeat protein
MQKDDVLLRMKAGTEFTVQEVRDEWIGGLVRLEEAPRTGWVRSTDLVPLEKAYPRFRDMLADNPRNYELLLVNARLLRDQEKWEASRRLYDQAVKVSSRDKRALLQRGYLNYLTQNYQAAVEDYTKALKIDSKDVLAYTNRGLNRQALGQLEEALADYDRALELNERNALAMNNAAWVRATAADDAVRDTKLAVAFAESACELTNYENFEFLDTLAAAHADAGQFEQALKYIALALKQAPAEVQAELQQRQQLYKQGKPFRDRSLEKGGKN